MGVTRPRASFAAVGLVAPLALTLGSLFALAGCAAGHCRRTIEPPREAVPVDATPSPARADSLKAKDRVLVYKYDGGIQCDGSHLVPLEVMAKELKDIPILSQDRRNDGLIHISSCDASTGNANVYEISAKYLKRAEQRGFRRWKFD